jgi:hypothetical protein
MSYHALRVKHVEFKLRVRDVFVDTSVVSNLLFGDIESVKIHCHIVKTIRFGMAINYGMKWVTVG